MGYDLHITRRKDWSDSNGPSISEQDWQTLVRADSELQIGDPINQPNFATFGEEAWFDWSDGHVFTKNPDRQTLEKMLELADRLGAKVQGDDGETYDVNSLDGYETTHRAAEGKWIAYFRFFGTWLAIYVLLLIIGILIALWIL